MSIDTATLSDQELAELRDLLLRLREENEADLHEIPEEVKKKMTFHLASNLMEVYAVAFGTKLPREKKKPAAKKHSRRSQQSAHP